MPFAFLIFLGSLCMPWVAKGEHFILEFSPLRASIGEADVQMESSLMGALSWQVRGSQAHRQSGPEAFHTERRYEAGVVYYLEPGEGAFLGAKITHGIRDEFFHAYPLSQSYTHFDMTSSEMSHAEISRTSAGVKLGWRFAPARYLTFAISGDILSTIQQTSRLVSASFGSELSSAQLQDLAGDRFTSQFMMHVGLVIP